MRTGWSRLRHPIVIVGVCLAFGLVLAHQAGLRLNTTRSIPLGLYRMSADPIETGAYVLWCPPDRPEFDLAKERGYIGAGFCPGGYGNMMKKVVASHHDVVSVTDDGIIINGTLMPASQPFETDSIGRPLPRFRVTDHVLAYSEFLLMSDTNSRSFDARYFGPIHRDHIQSLIHPVWTWE
ncbi:MAG: conjugal transfer protein TraF [Nitrospira sp. HN-bin3]|uniref:conjugative transfer signal peptidase TraF n=1 Tax=Nitrospira cf. moscoviensis SBR1015 TaxID=96242 RepID=UPI000A0A214C|nr:conjugative transfer signal peptidase TraF [Nitrospira cf. moscoviensis SBR1015]OQW45419.1 MAG: conjugal transfer protein TraF [Nitrospira sp. HN-bin3]